MRAVVLAIVAFAGCLGSQASLGLPFEASSFVRADPFPVLLVEIDHVEGRPPSAMALDALRSALADVTAKREIRFPPFGTFPAEPGGRPWSEVAELQREVRSFETGGDTIVLQVTYADSTCREGDKGLLGFESGRRVVICVKAIDEGPQAGPLVVPDPSRERVERAVLVHEAGHVLGLVNHGAPMVRPHEDREHLGHSASRESVMFWQMDAQDALLGFLADETGPAFAFDADDLADLKALRERS